MKFNLQCKGFLWVLSSMTVVLLLSACHKTTDKNTINVGVMAGPEADLMMVAKHVMKRQYGVKVQVIQFSDYAMPNAALASGDIDANMFQHAPYLRNVIRHRHYQFSIIGKTFIYPMAIYSKRLRSLTDLQAGATVAIPNDPSNGARALLLLQQAGLLQLRSGVDTTASITDIIANPKHVHIKELNAAQLPRVLSTVALAVINTNYAIPAGLSLKKEGLLSEDKHSLYANVIVVRRADKAKPQLQDLVKALHSKAVLAKAKQLFNNTAIAAW